MLGIKLKAYPSPKQRIKLSQWMGCARFIYNAKCDEDRYFRAYASKFSTYDKVPVDQKYSQFKGPETDWLKSCPSELQRNSVVAWYKAYWKYIKKEVKGRPTRKKKHRNSLMLDSKCFRFEGNNLYIFDSKKWGFGHLKLKLTPRAKFAIKNNEIKTLIIKKQAATYTVSFCFNDPLAQDEGFSDEEHFKFLKGKTEDELKDLIKGYDRGVVHIASGSDGKHHDFTDAEVRSASKAEKYKRRYQRVMARRKRGSHRYKKAKYQMAKHSQKISNIRHDRLHKISHEIVVKDKASVIVMEDLNLKGMTKKPKAKQCEVTGKWLKNKAKAKAGLNKAMLHNGLSKLKDISYYKAKRFGKAFFLINPSYSSQECADCGHIHSDNRKSQSIFKCVACRIERNADENAGMVLQKRAIKLILDPGAGLVGAKSMPKRLSMSSNHGRSTKAKAKSRIRKTRKPKGVVQSRKPSKKKEKAIEIPLPRPIQESWSEIFCS